jgi:hypothetical protein
VRRPPLMTETESPRGTRDLRPEWLLERDGTRYVRYAGLLALAHARGLKRITTALVQAPDVANGHVAIAAAEVETTQGVFTGLGEATLPRLAEMRAKAQALADAVNVGLPVFETCTAAPGAGAPRGQP